MTRDIGKLLELQDRPFIEPLLDRLNCPLSEYSFANLFLFRSVHEYRLVREPFPFLKGVTYDRKIHAMPLISIDESHIAAMLEVSACIYPLPFELAQRFAVTDISLDWQEADSDYIYDAATLSALAGPRLRSRFEQARHFERLASPAVEPLGSKNLHLARRVLDTWQQQRPASHQATDVQACLEALRLYDDLDLKGMLVLDRDGTPRAFLIASRLADDSMAVHFAKGDRGIPGAYPYLFSRFAAHGSAPRLNFEQDLGVPGLRQAKRALAPVDQLRKCRLSRSPSDLGSSS